MKVRPATHADIKGILEILNYEIVNDVMAWDVEPVEGPARQAWFEARTRPGYPLLVAETGNGDIAGWAGLSRWAHHAAYEKTAEVSIYVHQDERGRGVGTALMTELVDIGRDQGLHVLISRSEASNEPSRRLHFGTGFRSVGVMHEVGLKFERFLDAEIFELIL